ncbi:hypothetical protein LCGC14_0619280 [marine sediment metagenome]|uniref:Uncharacterized protein n=1 Tax=marine sediment metagenome TaxID=412755 RepID=A0A0F9TRM1_9ZZZZ
MSNNTHDNIPVEQIHIRKPRPEQAWDQLLDDEKENASTQNQNKKPKRTRTRN